MPAFGDALRGYAFLFIAETASAAGTAASTGPSPSATGSHSLGTTYCRGATQPRQPEFDSYGLQVLQRGRQPLLRER